MKTKPYFIQSFTPYQDNPIYSFFVSGLFYDYDCLLIPKTLVSEHEYLKKQFNKNNFDKIQKDLISIYPKLSPYNQEYYIIFCNTLIKDFFQKFSPVLKPYYYSPSNHYEYKLSGLEYSQCINNKTFPIAISFEGLLHDFYFHAMGLNLITEDIFNRVCSKTMSPTELTLIPQTMELLTIAPLLSTQDPKSLIEEFQRYLEPPKNWTTTMSVNVLKSHKMDILLKELQPKSRLFSS